MKKQKKFLRIISMLIVTITISAFMSLNVSADPVYHSLYKNYNTSYNYWLVNYTVNLQVFNTHNAKTKIVKTIWGPIKHTKGSPAPSINVTQTTSISASLSTTNSNQFGVSVPVKAVDVSASAGMSTTMSGTYTASTIKSIAYQLERNDPTGYYGVTVKQNYRYSSIYTWKTKDPGKYISDKTGNFYQLNGKPYLQLHYDAKNSWN